MHDDPGQRRSARRWVPGTANLLAVLVLYFALPTAAHGSATTLLLRLGTSLVGVVGVAVVLARELRRERRHEPGLGVLRLVLLAEVALVALVAFSLAYYVLATQVTGQMEGISTRIDALYFTLSTTATVGYGDIHPTGQLARAVASAHIVFEVVALGIAGRLVTARLGARRPGVAPGEPPG